MITFDTVIYRKKSHSILNILLITPPFTQLNTPYPATTVLKGFLRAEGFDRVEQWDMSIDLLCRIFGREKLEQIFAMPLPATHRVSSNALLIRANKDRYVSTIDAVWRFLQGRDLSLATRITSGEFLPEASRFKTYTPEELDWAFGSSATQDRAKHLATLYIQDLTDYIRECVSDNFDLVRYAEKLALSAPDFAPLEHAIHQRDIIADWMIEMLDEKISLAPVDFVGFTVPFPGCLLAALQCANHIKRNYPHVTIAMGGGYPTTELRSMRSRGIFRYVDHLILDEGYSELLTALGRHNATPKSEDYVPDFSDLDPGQYVSLLEMTNPMHRLWSDGFWNKLTLARGCYWARCAFCDTSLDYIGCYKATPATKIVDKMESIMAQTGCSGFHFTDEALPPKLLREVAHEILRREICVSFWGNIRFEKAFTPELCQLLSSAGMIAASGGMEVASERILNLINKGVSIPQAARTMSNMTSAGIMVHAYLMYGFPTQTLQESVDALEVVRQMFSLGLIQSAFWHRFTMTVHSPVGQCPAKFGITEHDTFDNSFANNGVEFTQTRDYDIDMLGEALRTSTYNYMHSLGLDTPLGRWFARGAKIPRTTHSSNYIETILTQN